MRSRPITCRYESPRPRPSNGATAPTQSYKDADYEFTTYHRLGAAPCPIAMSATSHAMWTAMERTIPESPPVMGATLSLSLSAPLKRGRNSGSGAFPVFAPAGGFCHGILAV